MPYRDGRLTPKERVFSATYANTGDKLYAAEKARYAFPLTESSSVLARPAVQADVVRRQLERLTNEALPAAVDDVIAAIKNPKAHAGLKAAAWKETFKHTLGREGSAPKELHELDGAELGERIQQLERRKRMAAATPIDVQVTTEPARVDPFG